MPPKKGKKSGKGKKGPKGPKLPVINEGLHTSEMSKTQLMTFIKRLLAEKDRELLERNLFMLEKSKLFNMWNLVMEQVKVLQNEAANSEVKRDVAMQQRDKEKELQEQKLRYLQNEQVKNCGMIRLHHLNYMKNLSDEIWAIENLLRESAVGKRMQLRKQMAAHYEILRGFHMKHGQAVSDMLVSLSKSLRTKEFFWERLFESRKDTAMAELTVNYGQIITKKLTTLDYMDETHEKMLQDCQTYFNDMTQNNFGVIVSLQHEVEQLKDENKRLERDLRHVKTKYSSVTTQLEELQREMSVWNDDVDGVEETVKLKELWAILERQRRCENNLRLMIEVLVQQIHYGKKQLDQVKSKYSMGLLKFQQRLCMRNMVDQLKKKAADRDAMVLRAVESVKKSGDVVPLHDLHEKIEHRHRKLRKVVAEMESTYSCKLPDAVDADMIDYGCGLRNKEGVILPPINPYAFPDFQGTSQNTRTRIHYKGADYSDPDSQAKDLGYGYFFLPNISQKTTPSSPYTVPTCPEVSHYSSSTPCKTRKGSKFLDVVGRPTLSPTVVQKQVDLNEMFASKTSNAKSCNEVLKPYRSVLRGSNPYTSHEQVQE